MRFTVLATVLALVALALLISITGCAGLRYTGSEFYYTTPDGVHWSCREPKPFKGGNCRPEALWPKPGLN